jgi:DNA-binding transcriptional MerR regulator/Flp pilus assembly protein TadD
VSESTIQQQELRLSGTRVALVGKLASMPRREAEQLIIAHGGRVVERPGRSADMIVVGDDAPPLPRLVAERDLFDDATRAALVDGTLELVRESELWGRLGLVDLGPGIERLYTPAMLAELLSVPVAAIRHWHRRGSLRATRDVRRLPYFDFEEVRVARKLAQLLAAGCSVATVSRQVAELDRLMPEVPRPLSDPAVVIEGRRVFVRRGDNLAEPTGQLLIDFDANIAEGDAIDDGTPTVPLPLLAADSLRGRSNRTPGSGHPLLADDLRCLAAELSGNARHVQAIDVYRAILVSGQATADDHFALAELLYQCGDLSAARERYYVAIELDENFVEARSNLGCVLAESEELDLAEAAFRGALEFHPDYADAHYHLARLLDRAHRPDEAVIHWQLFMSLAPASPWADEARERIAGLGSWRSAFGSLPDDLRVADGLADSR